LRYSFLELPDDAAMLGRPVIPVVVEDLEEFPQLCLVDTGTIANRFAPWLAGVAGIDLAGAPRERIALGGIVTTAFHARAELTVAEVRFQAPVTFCDPWPYKFNLLGQEGFLRFFRVTISAAEMWLDVEPELWS
jgi:hypothetical protein